MQASGPTLLGVDVLWVATVLSAIATFAVLIAMERLWPHSPAPLVAVAGGIAAAWFLGLEKMGVSIVGLIPRGFPSLTLPDRLRTARESSGRRRAARCHDPRRDLPRRGLPARRLDRGLCLRQPVVWSGRMMGGW